jgi:L-lactate dehydrogenase complex protein LldE
MSVTSSPYVGLLVTCLVDLLRPNVGFAAVQLLEQAGCRVDVPDKQTCCGQPAYNNGDLPHTEAIAKQVIETFAAFDYVVIPSGSCAGMLKHHYPQLFQQDPDWQAKAQAFSQRCYELTTFLTEICGLEQIKAQFEHTVTYHDSCSGLRELGIKNQPRQLLARVQGLYLREMQETETCCGFGGTFCVKYPDISTCMVDNKLADIQVTGAEVVLAGDMGCLLNIAGRLHRLGKPIRVYHVAEVLANLTTCPAIGESQPD